MRLMRGIATAVLLAGLAAGCDGQSTEAAAPSEPPSSGPGSATPSQGSTPAPVPPAVRAAFTQSDAVRFGMYFIDLMNFALVSGELDQFRSEYSRQCEACEAVRAELAKIYGAKGSVTGGEYEVNAYSSVRADRKTWTVGFEATAGQQTILRSSRHDPELRSGGDYSVTLDVTRRNADIWITRLQVVER